jgi:hypothetical protein
LNLGETAFAECCCCCCDDGWEVRWVWWEYFGLKDRRWGWSMWKAIEGLNLKNEVGVCPEDTVWRVWSIGNRWWISLCLAWRQCKSILFQILRLPEAIVTFTFCFPKSSDLDPLLFYFLLFSLLCYLQLLDLSDDWEKNSKETDMGFGIQMLSEEELITF